MAKLYFVVVAVALVALLATRKLSMTLLFENHQTCATFELIFLGSSGFKEEGRALKDVALDGVALPSIVALDCPQWPESSQLPLSALN